MNHHSMFQVTVPSKGVARSKPSLARGIPALIAATAIALLGTVGALAQDATPTGAGTFASLGLPELQVTISNDNLTVDQSEVPAGRYLVHFTNSSDNPEASAGFVRLLEGASLADLSWADELAAGTPVPGEMDPQPGGLEWLYDTYITGAGSALSPEVVVDLPAGDYGLWADDPVSTIAAAPLTVTGEADATITGPEPEAAVTIVEEGAGGEGFHFTLQGALVGGPQVVKVLNASDQPHFILGLQYPEPITEEQLMATMMFDPSTGATPSPDMLDFEQVQTVAWVSAQSAGTTQWATMDLQPGQVILLCFVTDPAAGEVPHAFEGMTQLFDVAQS